MNKNTQIKTHFDNKIIGFFLFFLIVSCILLWYKKQSQENCNLAGFKIDTKTFKAKEMITFSDTTNKAVNWNWDFGDGTTTSSLSKVSHSYEEPGNYTVTLNVGQACVVEKQIAILPFEEKVDQSLMPNFSAPSRIVVGEAVTFKDLTPNATSWQWKFGDSGTEGGQFDSTDKNPSYTFKTGGLKKVTLAVNGNYNYVKKIDVFVQVAKAKAEAIEVVKMNVKKERGPEKQGVTGAYVLAMMNGISKNELTFINFCKYFCTDALPEVHLRDGRIISLRELDDDIRSNSIKIKKVNIVKDDDGCVTSIDANYKK